jgi:ribosome-binding factor A
VSQARKKIKEAQLCAEVRETLSLALAQSDDDRLLSLAIIDVVPAPDASRLAVWVEVPPEQDIEEARELLEHKRGALRTEIAEAIQRKKTPVLFFDLRPRA